MPEFIPKSLKLNTNHYSIDELLALYAQIHKSYERAKFYWYRAYLRTQQKRTWYQRKETCRHHMYEIRQTLKINHAIKDPILFVSDKLGYW